MHPLAIVLAKAIVKKSKEPKKYKSKLRKRKKENLEKDSLKLLTLVDTNTPPEKKV